MEKTEEQSAALQAEVRKGVVRGTITESDVPAVMADLQRDWTYQEITGIGLPHPYEEIQQCVVEIRTLLAAVEPQVRAKIWEQIRDILLNIDTLDLVEEQPSLHDFFLHDFPLPKEWRDG